MTPRIETIPHKKLVGQSLTMSFAHYRVASLWQIFLPCRKEIAKPLNRDLISMAIYPPHHFKAFKPTNLFERWAAVEVADFDDVPDQMQTFVLPGGLYAVFNYKGLHTDHSIFESIFTTWLPASGYVLDDRPHFEVLGEKYSNNDPESEEEIWIPIKNKAGHQP